MNGCDAWRDDLVEYAAQVTAPAGRARIEAHLRDCGACRDLVAEWEVIRREVRATEMRRASSAPASGCALARVRAGTRDAEDVRSGSAAARRSGIAARLDAWRAPRTSPQPGLLVAAALVVVALGAALALRLAGVEPGSRGTAGVSAPASRDDGSRSGALATGATARLARPTAVARRAAPTLGGALVHAAPGLAPGAPIPPMIVVVAPHQSGPHDTPVAALGSPTQPAPPHLAGEGGAVGPDGASATAASPRGSASPTACAPASPAPTPTVAGPEGAIVAGVTRGVGGIGRAEVTVRALAADGRGLIETVTGVTGAFTLAVPSGRWLIEADAPGYVPRWHPGRSNPYDAEVMRLSDGDRIEVAFDLARAPDGLVTGRATFADGAPAARAVVMAVPRDVADDDASAMRGQAVLTDPQGRYVLRLPPGDYAFAVAADWTTRPAVWWYGRPDPSQADTLSLADGQRWEPVDFVLP